MRTAISHRFAAAAVLAILYPAGLSGKTSVWKVHAEEGRATVYLAGSVHLLGEDDHPLPKAFEGAYAATAGLVLEVVSNEDPEIQTRALREGMHGEGGGIQDDISPESYQKLREFLTGRRLPAAAMDRFKPWLAAMTISLTEITKLGYRAELGVDSFFEGRAIRDGKPIEGLETAAFQIGLFSKLDKKLQEQMLVATLEDMGAIEKDYPRLVKAWREGDDPKLERILRDSMGDVPEFRDEILDKRNQRWVGRLEEMLAGERDLMVVVGAGHLVGDAGVVELLRAKGYQVERLATQPAKKPRKGNPPGKRLIPVSGDRLSESDFF